MSPHLLVALSAQAVILADRAKYYNMAWMW